MDKNILLPQRKEGRHKDIIDILQLKCLIFPSLQNSTPISLSVYIDLCMVYLQEQFDLYIVCMLSFFAFQMLPIYVHVYLFSNLLYVHAAMFSVVVFLFVVVCLFLFIFL